MNKSFLIGISAVLLIVNLVVCAEKNIGGGVAKVNQDSIDSVAVVDSLLAVIDSIPAEIYVDSLDAVPDNSSIVPIYETVALVTGDKPWSDYYSRARRGSSSDITVQAGGSQVVVTIKHNDRVVDHAYIGAADRYTFKLPNGTYQAFFYYGSEWSPEKPMPNGVYGGFLYNEVVSKDSPVELHNQGLTYTLYSVSNGNLQTQSSSLYEAL